MAALLDHFWTPLEHFWTIVDIKNQIMPSKASPRPPPPKSPHPFGHLLGPLFLIFLHFLIKKVGSEICHVFSLILGSPWALHGMGSHAIRTRLRSRNTLFRFCMFSKKMAPHDLILIPVWHPFLTKIIILSEKRAPQNY